MKFKKYLFLYSEQMDIIYFILSMNCFVVCHNDMLFCKMPQWKSVMSNCVTFQITIFYPLIFYFKRAPSEFKILRLESMSQQLILHVK